MIDIRRIDNTLRYDEYDHIFMIVRSSKINNPHIVQMPELAPSDQLFFTYRQWVKDDNWNQDTFDEKYVPWFLRDLIVNPQSREALNRLYQMDQEGKRICLLCYCGLETMCHRSIIAGLLQGVGANVRMLPVDNSFSRDYTKYYNDYRYLKLSLTQKLDQIQFSERL